MGGGGRGQGRGNRMSGQLGGRLTQGTTDNCVCLSCGRKEPHQRGTALLSAYLPVLWRGDDQGVGR